MANEKTTEKAAAVNGHVAPPATDGRRGPRGPRTPKTLTFADHVGALIRAFDGIPTAERERAFGALRAMYPAPVAG
jgi:hypothetical protein